MQRPQAIRSPARRPGWAARDPRAGAAVAGLFASASPPSVSFSSNYQARLSPSRDCRARPSRRSRAARPLQCADAPVCPSLALLIYLSISPHLSPSPLAFIYHSPLRDLGIFLVLLAGRPRRRGGGVRAREALP